MVLTDLEGNIIERRPRERRPIVEEFVSSSAWTEDKNCHYLLVDLPGFQKEQMKLQINDGGSITVSGERMLNNEKGISFRQTFQPMPNSDIHKIAGKFDGEKLYVTVPKLEVEKESEVAAHDDDDNHENETDRGGITRDATQERLSNNENHAHVKTKVTPKPDLSKKNWREAPEIIMKVIRKNQRILVTTVVAFSLGVYIARKFDSAGQERNMTCLFFSNYPLKNVIAE